MVDDLIDKILNGEDPRDVVDEITTTGAISTHPKAMAIVHHTRSRKRRHHAQKPKLSSPNVHDTKVDEGNACSRDEYAASIRRREQTKRLTWHTFKKLRKQTGYAKGSSKLDPKKVDWSAVEDLAAGLHELGFKWIAKDLVRARKQLKGKSYDPGSYASKILVIPFEDIEKYQVQIFGNKIIKEVDRGPENWVHGVKGPQPAGFFWDLLPATSPGGVYPDHWPWDNQSRKKYGGNTAFNKRPDPGKSDHKAPKA